MFKRNKFKYVKFSKGTAKKNPDMVSREYKRIIGDLENKISALYEGKHEVSIIIDKSRVGSNHPTLPYWEYKTSVTLSSLEIIEYYKKIVKNDADKLKALKILEEVEKEFERFKLKYNDK